MPSEGLTGFSSAFDELLERSRREAGRVVGRPGCADALVDFPNVRESLGRNLRGGCARHCATHFRSRDPRVRITVRAPLARGARARRKARSGLALRGPRPDPRRRRAGRAVPGDRALARREPHLARLGRVVRRGRWRRIGSVGHGWKCTLRPGRRRRETRSDPGRTRGRASGHRIRTGRLCAAAVTQCDSTFELAEVVHDHTRRNRGCFPSAQPDRRSGDNPSTNHDHGETHECRASCRGRLERNQ